MRHPVSSIFIQFHSFFSAENWRLSNGRLLLIIMMSICYGMELTYKLATNQLIFILNPCHVMCLLQLSVLSMNPFTSGAQEMFKMVINGLYAPICACVFPVTNTLFLPGEIFTFWLEHVLLLIIPLYLIYENQLELESLTSYKSCLRLFGYYYIYNLLLIQPLSIVTKANVNNLLCPAITDPFAGPGYRLHTLWHQLTAMIIGSKLVILLRKTVNNCLPRTKFE